VLVVALEFSMPPATKSSHHDLRVFFPGIVHAEFLAEEFHHGGSASIVDGEAVAATPLAHNR